MRLTHLFPRLRLCQKPVAALAQRHPVAFDLWVWYSSAMTTSPPPSRQDEPGPFPELMRPPLRQKLSRWSACPAGAGGVGYPLGAGSLPGGSSPAPLPRRRRPADCCRWFQYRGCRHCRAGRMAGISRARDGRRWKAPQSGGGRRRSSSARPAPFAELPLYPGARPGEPCAEHGQLEPTQDGACHDGYLTHPAQGGAHCIGASYGRKPDRSGVSSRGAGPNRDRLLAPPAGRDLAKRGGMWSGGEARVGRAAPAWDHLPGGGARRQTGGVGGSLSGRHLGSGRVPRPAPCIPASMCWAYCPHGVPLPRPLCGS